MTSNLALKFWESMSELPPIEVAIQPIYQTNFNGLETNTDVLKI